MKKSRSRVSVTPSSLIACATRNAPLSPQILNNAEPIYNKFPATPTSSTSTNSSSFPPPLTRLPEEPKFMKLFVFLWLMSAALSYSEDTPEINLQKLAEKHDAPKLPDTVAADAVWYQLFVIPEVSGGDQYPIIVTVELKFDSAFHATSGALEAHASKNNQTKLMGKVNLSAEQAAELLRAVCQNEVFSLPTKYNVARYEYFPHFGGMGYVFVRKDQHGLRIVGRQDWSSEPFMNAANKFTELALPLFPK